MKALRTFFMEDWLESFRFQAKFNLGESGGRPKVVQELLSLSGVSKQNSTDTFLQMKLCDSPNRGRDDLRQLVANMHPGANIDNVLITTGTSEALFLLFRHLNPKKVALALPAFQLLYELPVSLGAKIIPLPIRYSEFGQPFIDEEEWLETIRNQQPDCIIINNPHNPSGLILSQEFISKVTKLSQDINCNLIGDEHYRFLSSDTETLGNTIYQNNENTFITGSFIKCFGTPGLRIGWCVGSQKALNAMQNEKNYTTHTVNPISEWISFEILKNQNSNLFQFVKKEWLENKNILTQFLNQSKTLYGCAPEGGLVTSLGFKNRNKSKDIQVLFNQLFQKEIFVLPLSSMEFGSFDFQNEEFYKNVKLSEINKGCGFRLGMGIEPQQFKKALDEIEKALTL
ncbi:pyridoxal phosphate-dependent aminotransferase [Silvanigrella aquatica]|uniref:Aminotransferase class I n=1 Tax=Silvanigrella aquatica TaxID=1915309 RepID=A0A1L4D071_9BACT|nr:pyridoxal phosphate-dependent aminotransferase [Silvanigrella aquatica]APJ03603.1 aminotransferase class I [Silvanigrella aquatica]